MNFGSTLNRVKQQADRLFLRGDKTDVSGDLRYAEDQAEELRILIEAFSKSLEKNINTHLVTEVKKYKKVPENQAAEVLKDALKELPQNQDEECASTPLLRTVLEEIIGVELLLGKCVLDFEEKVELDVLIQFQKLLKEDFPSAAKLKKALKQAGQDVGSLRAKIRGSNVNTTQPNKLESYKEDLEEAELRLEHLKDSYASDLFGILSQQRKLARLTYVYLEMKAEHMEKSLHRLNSHLPAIKSICDESLCSPVYGVPLHDHLRITKQDVAVPIKICVRKMVEFGMYEEGLLRVAGSNNKIKRLKGILDAGLLSVESRPREECHGEYDVHVFAGAFKSYLRELPEPLLSHVKHDEFVEASRIGDHKERLREIWQCVNSLPTANYNNLQYVVKFLSMLASFSKDNKMTHNNIAIVMAPNLIGGSPNADNEMVAMGRSMTLGNDYRVLVEQLVEYCDYFFKGDVDFGVAPRKPEPPPSPRLPAANPLNGLPTAKPDSHRRTGSADFNAVGTAPPESESPKQPHRVKKKPAPRPPQGSTHDETTLPVPPAENSLSKSPPGPGVAHQPQPAPRLAYTNSLKRPSSVPPRPPGTVSSPAKPPRPSPPLLVSEIKDSPPLETAQSTDSKSVNAASHAQNVAIGFEHIDCIDSHADGKGSIGLIPPPGEFVCDLTPAKPSNEDHFRPGKLNESTEEGDEDNGVELRKSVNKNVSNPEFRKSLEDFLKSQPNPQFAQPRHMVRNSYSSDSNNGSKSEDRTPLSSSVPVVPIPAQRTILEKAEALASSREKPVVPEKPSAIGTNQPKPPISAERPAISAKPAGSALLTQTAPRIQCQAVDSSDVSGDASENEECVRSQSTDVGSNKDNSNTLADSTCAKSTTKL